MKKLLIILGLAATVGLVGCNKGNTPKTGATTNGSQEKVADEKAAKKN